LFTLRHGRHGKRGKGVFMEKTKIVVIVGPTAAGKTAFSCELAGIFDAEIISADSRQVYKHMDIGTAKPTEKQRNSVPHHLIDVCRPDSGYSAADFKRDAEESLRAVSSRGKRAFIVGGAGLYVRAFLEGLFIGPGNIASVRETLLKEERLFGREYLHKELSRVDPVSASRIHPNNIHRVMRALEVYSFSGRPISSFWEEHGFREKNYDTLKIGLIKERGVLYRDIEKRIDKMMEEGLLEETGRLLEMGFSAELKSMRSLGYREMIGHINGVFSLDEAAGALKKNTRNYAKRQITWFKKDKDVVWFSPGDKEGVVSLVRDFYSKQSNPRVCG